MNFLRRSLWISSKPILIFALLASLASFAFSQTRGGAVAKPQNLGAEILPSYHLDHTAEPAQQSRARRTGPPDVSTGPPNHHHFLTREQYRSRLRRPQPRPPRCVPTRLRTTSR